MEFYLQTRPMPATCTSCPTASGQSATQLQEHPIGQVRKILWATKQQVEVSTPATISSAIPPCSEDRSALLSEETTCRVVLVASQASSDKKETIGAVTPTVIPPTPFPLIYSPTVGTSPMVIQTSPSLSSPTSQPLPWIYIITWHRLNSWLSKGLIWVIAPA